MKETGSSGKQQDEQREMSYKEAEEWIEATTGGRGTDLYSDTNKEAVRKLNKESQERNQEAD